MSLYLCVPTDVPASWLHFFAARKTAEPQKWATVILKTTDAFQTSPVLVSPWINDKVLITLLKPLFFFFCKTIFLSFPILTEWTFITIRCVWSLTAGLNVTFCLRLCSESICSRSFFSLSTGASSQPVPTDFSSAFRPLGLWSHTLHWMGEWMNERTSWCFSLPCPHWCGPQE